MADQHGSSQPAVGRAMMGGNVIRNRVTLLAVAGLAAVALVSACEEPEEPARPVSITVEPPAAQLTWLGETVVFRASIKDQHGAPYPGTVTWASSDEALFTIDAGGTVTAVASGSGTVTATFEGLSGTATVEVTQTPASVETVSGDGQEERAGALLPEPVVVRATDAGGAPVEGVRVAFTLGDGHGTADPPAAPTDAAGLARTAWTLGEIPGAQTLSAVVNDVSVRVGATAINPDPAALEAFYHATGGPGWTNSDNWLTDAPLEEWHGVETNRHGRVSSLKLGFNGLSGRIPPEVGELSSLETLTILYHEGLEGSVIPPEIAKLSNLTGISLNGNGLTGEIPPELGMLSKLQLLGIAQNRLEGSIPPELGNLSALGTLLLGQNRLTGRIPDELGNLRAFLISLEYNRFSGGIPANLGQGGALEKLYLNGAGLTGSIPPEIGGWGRLYQLHLGGNDLTGQIPGELGRLQQLEVLDLSRNGLTGGVPAELSGARLLEVLNLVGNAGMSGALPAELRALRLNTFLASGTELCVPRDNEFQAWLAAIPTRYVGLCAPEGAFAYLTQAVQSIRFPVPLVAGQDALLRVFLTADGAGDARIPPMRATFFQDGREIHVADVPGQNTPIPSEIDEGNLEATGNVLIPASVTIPGLEFVVEVDPDGTLDPSLNIQKRIPETGRLPAGVQAVPTFELVVVPFLRVDEPDSSIIDIANELSPDHELFGLTRTLLPVNDMEVSIHEPVWTSSTYASGMLEELRLLKLAESGTEYYMGITLPAVGGGVAFGGWRVAVSDLEDWIVAHELGHTMSLLHAPCGGPLGVDPLYPHDDGATGSWGYDFQSAALVPPDTPELMGYCGSNWISDYHFSKAFGDRVTNEGNASAAPRQSLLLWGGANAAGEPYLEPSFVLDAPRALPERDGAYRIAGLNERGDELFSLSFDMDEAADGDGSSSFAFVLPARPEWAGALASIRLTGPGGGVELGRDGPSMAALLRDPATGRVRGILRDWPGTGSVGADGTVWDRFGPGLDVQVSRGVPGAEGWRR